LRLHDLEAALHRHCGEFLCEEIRNEQRTKRAGFVHATTAPGGLEGVPDVGRLRDFYETFGSLVLYLHEKSGDAARRIAPPSEWAELHASFSQWTELVDEGEVGPEWLVIGETPQSGNYILVATQGTGAGHVFEFDHDGFEFTEQALDVVEYVEKLLRPDAARLTNFASHMRFIEDDDPDRTQWWIRELRDDTGLVVQTSA
jgi:hypothetical protein